MNSYSLSHLADQVLVKDLKALNSQDRTTTAALLAHIGEMGARRRLFLSAAYPSMHAYCVGELRMSEDMAYKRIQAARAARKFPAIFSSVADGRLHLTAAVLLAPHLLAPYMTAAKADELITAAAHKTKTEIGLLLAAHFPVPDAPTTVRLVSTNGVNDRVVPEPVLSTLRRMGIPMEPLVPEPVVPSVAPNTAVSMEPLTPRQVGAPIEQMVPGPVGEHARVQVDRPKVTPLSPGRFEVRVTLSQVAHDNLRYAQSMLGHAVPSGDLAEVLESALDSFVQELEKKKFAKCARTRTRRGMTNGRYVAADVRRTVSQRDGGQCTFVSDKGKRCEGRVRLELDHIEPVPRGGETTATNLRLRCRAHNQHAADRVFGAGFMDRKRQEARARKTRAQAEAAAKVEPASTPKTSPAATLC